jgi:hypothetical protein
LRETSPRSSGNHPRIEGTFQLHKLGSDYDDCGRHCDHSHSTEISSRLECVHTFWRVSRGFDSMLRLLLFRRANLNHGEKVLLKNSAKFSISQSEELQNSIYSSKWYEIKDIATRKKILFMLMVSQDVKQFTAGGIFTMGLKTFANIINNSYRLLAYVQNAL